MKALEGWLGNEKAHETGRYYFCVMTPGWGEMTVFADRASVSPSGALLFHSEQRHEPHKGEECLVLALAAHQWVSVHAASVFDGSPICLDRGATDE